MSYNPVNPNGQTTMANSSPVVLASNQSAVPISLDAVTITNLDIRDLVFATDKVDISGSTLGANSGVDIGDVTINNASLAVTIAQDIMLGTDFSDVLGTASLILGTQADDIANTVDGLQTSSFGYMFDGVTWDRVRGTSADGLLVNLGANNDVTVTGTVAISAVSLPLPTGASTLAEQQTQTTSLQLLDDTVATTGAAITSKGFAISGTDGTDARILKTDANGELQVDILTMPAITVDSEFPTAAAITDNFANPTTTNVMSMGMLWDGATWDRAKGDSTDGALVNLGTNNDVTVTGSVTANAGTNLNTSLLALEGGGNLATIAGKDFATQTTLASLLTSSQLIDDIIFTSGTSTYTEATSKGALSLAVRRDADTTLVDTTNEMAPLQLNAAGQLKVALITSLPAGTNGIGKLTANAGVTIGAVEIAAAQTLATVSTVTNLSQMSGTAISMNTGVRDAGTQRVTIATNDAVPVTFTGSTDVATQTTLASLLTSSQLIDDTVFTDDTSTHSTGSTKGLGIMAVANPTDAAVDANDIGMVAMTLARAMKNDITTIAGTAPTTAGFIDIKGADGNVFVRNATAANLKVEATIAAAQTLSTVTTVSTVTNLSQLGGAAVPIGAGLEATAVRVTLPTDGTGVVTAKQATAANLLATVNTRDGVGNGYTTNSTTYTAKFAQDANLLGTLGTAFSTAGFVDIKGADGNVFVRNATAANLKVEATIAAAQTLSTVTTVGAVTAITNALPVGANVIGKVSIDQATPGTTNAVQDIPATSGGLSKFHLVSAATDNATNIKASAGQVYAITAFNLNASPRYLKFHNTAGTPTAGAGVTDTYLIPGNTSGAGLVINIDKGIAFGTGIGITIVTGITDAASGAVAASEIVVNIYYK